MDLDVILSAETSRFFPDPVFLKITEEVTGMPVRLSREHGGSDARFFSCLGIPVIMSRPKVGNIHSEREWIEIDSMTTLYRIYERYMEAKLLG